MYLERFFVFDSPSEKYGQPLCPPGQSAISLYVSDPKQWSASSLEGTEDAAVQK